MTLDHALLLVALVACAVGAAIDLRTGTIPNWLTFGVFVAAPLVRGAAAIADHVAWTAVLAAVLRALSGGVLAALLPALLSRRGGLGLGDVKLFAAIGATCGAFVALYAQTYAYVFGMIYGIVLVVRTGRLKSTLRNVRGVLAGSRQPPPAAFTEMRFGPAILAGMCVAVWLRWRA